MTGTSLSAVQRYQAMPITERARAKFDAKQVELIRHTVAAGCSEAECSIFLEECARLELDPFAKQIWAIKIRGKMQIVVSRDGLLLLANRQPDFRGCQSYEIREHDLFIPSVDENGHVHVRHEWRDKDGNPTHGGKDGMLRGDIVAGFAYVRREGHVDTQFMAYRSQYDQRQNVWLSHPSAMIVKVPEGMALRKAYSITGVTVEGELPVDDRTLTSPAAPPQQIDWGEDEKLAADLKECFEALRWTHAKVRTVMRGADSQGKREELLGRLREEMCGEIVDAQIVDAADGLAA